MKIVNVMAASLVLMTGFAFAQQQDAMASKTEMHAGSANVEQHLKDMENQWVKASKAGDSDTVASMLADDFVNIDSDGTMHSKAETVGRIKKAKWETNEISDVAVNNHGDTAVVTGTWTGKGVDGKGQTIDGKERWADTWVMKNGKWQCVASASAPMK